MKSKEALSVAQALESESLYSAHINNSITQECPVSGLTAVTLCITQIF